MSDRIRIGGDVGGIELPPGYTIMVGDQEYEFTEDGELRGVESLSVNELQDTTHYIGPGAPISEVNDKLEEIHDGETLFLRNGEYDVDESLEVPNHKRVTANRWQAKLIVDDVDDLDTYSDVPSSMGTAKCPVRNKSTEAENVRIENLHVRFDLEEFDNNDYTWAGVWLNDADHESHIQGCYAEDIMPDIDTSETRAFGILYTDCDGSTGYDLRGDNCGYEGIGVRGGNVGVTLERLRAFGNGTHAMQASGSVGGGDTPDDVQDRPQNITFRDIYCNGRVIMHGFARDDITKDDSNILVENVRFESPHTWSNTVRIHDECQGVVVRDAESVTIYVEHGSSNRSQNTLLENCGYDTDHWRARGNDGSPITVIASSSSADLNGLTLRNCTAAAPRLLHIEDRNGNATIRNVNLEHCYLEKPDISEPTAMVVLDRDDTTIENITFRNCWAKTDHLLMTEADGCEVENLRIFDSDLRDLDGDVLHDDGEDGELHIANSRTNVGQRAVGDDGWQNVAHISTDGDIDERIDMPDFVGQRGDGAVRVLVRLEQPSQDGEVSLRLPGQSSTGYYYRVVEEDGDTVRVSETDQFTLASNFGTGLRGVGAHAIFTCPRERPIITQGGGSSRGARGDYIRDGGVGGTTTFTWLEVETDVDPSALEVWIDATSRFIC